MRACSGRALEPAGAWNHGRVRNALVRFGLIATGLIYVAMGVVSARVAFLGARNREEGVPGALRLLMSQPHGSLLLGAVVLGLAALALVHAVEAGTTSLLAARADALDRCGLPHREPPPSFVGRLFAMRTIGREPLVEDCNQSPVPKAGPRVSEGDGSTPSA
jgi:hypothetical protein